LRITSHYPPISADMLAALLLSTPATLTTVSLSPLPALAAAGAARGTAATLGVGILAAYHRRLLTNEVRCPTWRSTQSATRKRWALHVSSTKGYLYAIQTLRNAITANTFMASTVISLFTLTVGFFYSILQREFQWDTLVRFVSVAILLLCSAYSFAQSARAMTHSGFMFAAIQGVEGQPPPSPELPLMRAESVGLLMAKSETSQWAGLRFLSLAAAAVVWVLGGEWCFLGASVALRLWFPSADQPPPLVGMDDGGCWAL